MNMRASLGECASVAMALIVVVSGADTAAGQSRDRMVAGAASPPEAAIGASTSAPTAVAAESEASSVEQGHAQLSESFEERRKWRLEMRRSALKDTQFDVHFRSYYFDRRNFDRSQNQAWAIGGWAELKTGYFFDRLALGATAYTSQRLYGDKDKDGTLLLEPGQQGYTVLGEAYADFRIADDVNLYAGRKGYDTPFINRNDTRMTPNTFEAIVLQGKAKLEGGDDGATLKYGAGYFSKIKERNSEDFVPMSVDAGATVDRGVFTAGTLYEKGNFSIGAIDYYCADIINIGYVEAKLKLAIHDDFQPRFAAQFTDQRSTGADLLQGDSFSAQQFGLKAELPVKQALFTTAFTHAAGGANLRSPWSGYPGYTGVQVQDFNRAGESAFLLRAGYEFKDLKGLSAYALAVLGTDPQGAGQYRQNEYDLNLQWAPPEGALKGLSVRVRYALVDQFGGASRNLTDFRAIINYGIKF